MLSSPVTLIGESPRTSQALMGTQLRKTRLVMDRLVKDRLHNAGDLYAGYTTLQNKDYHKLFSKTGG